MTTNNTNNDLGISPNTGVNWEKHLLKASDPSNYKFGAVQNKTVIKEDGNWLDLNYSFCIQKTTKTDLMNCVSQGAAKAIEAALELKFGIIRKVSVRFIAKMSNTTRDGNDFFSVGDAIRKNGFVFEEDWKYGEDMSWEEYYTEIPSYVMKKAKENFDKFDITYEIIGVGNNDLSVARKYGLPAVIGYAWNKGADGMYHDYGISPNHCFNNADMRADTSKPCLDSYPDDFQIDGDYPKSEFIKVLAPDYNIAYAMLYYVNLKTKETLMTKFKKIIRDIHGGIWFVKPVNDGKAIGKQKIDSLQALLWALVDEFGVENNNVSDSEMNKKVNWVFFR